MSDGPAYRTSTFLLSTFVCLFFFIFPIFLFLNICRSHTFGGDKNKLPLKNLAFLCCAISFSFLTLRYFFLKFKLKDL